MAEGAFCILVAGAAAMAWLLDVLLLWSHLGRVAMQLADDAAAAVAGASGGVRGTPVVQVAEVVKRRLPPRQMYACAVAGDGMPVVMYRGWRVIRCPSFTDPRQTSTKKLSCWVYRG